VTSSVERQTKPHLKIYRSKPRIEDAITRDELLRFTRQTERTEACKKHHSVVSACHADSSRQSLGVGGSLGEGGRPPFPPVGYLLRNGEHRFPNNIGPEELRPTKTWEIHPIKLLSER